MFPTLKAVYSAVVLIPYPIPFFSRPAYKKDYNVNLLPN